MSISLAASYNDIEPNALPAFFSRLECSRAYLPFLQSQYSSQERLHYGAPPLTPDGCCPPALSSSPSTIVALSHSHSLPKQQRPRHHHHHQHFDSNDSNTPLAAAVDGDSIGGDGHGSSGNSNSSGLRSPLLRPRSQSLRSSSCRVLLSQAKLILKY
jgi:hypothetical protein